jgi:hypothetical protein
MGAEPIVCKNSDYVLHFDLDEQWSPFAVKTVKIAYGDSFIPVVFNGNDVPLPKLPNTYLVGISLEAGDVRTAVPAWIECLPVLDDSVSEVPPPPENVYNQIMQMISSGVLTGARIVETVYMGTDANGGNVYKQIFDNGMESTFVAPKGLDAKFVLGEDVGTAYDGSKGAQNRRDINNLYGELEKVSADIKENADNIAKVDSALGKNKVSKPSTLKPHNFVSYDESKNRLVDTGCSAEDIINNANNISNNTTEITKNSNKIQKNTTDISNIKTNNNQMSTDIAQTKVEVSTLRVFLNELSNRLNSIADSTDVDLDQFSELVAFIKSNKSLIDNITTNKVNVADIVNNLTTDVSTKPLSAKQGVALKALIDALSEKAVKYSPQGYVQIDGGIYAEYFEEPSSGTLMNSEGIQAPKVSAEEIYADGYVGATEAYFGEDDDIHISKEGINLSDDAKIKRNGEEFVTKSYVDNRVEWDYVVEDSTALGVDLQYVSGNVLVKGGSHNDSELFIGENINHLRFEGTVFEYDNLSFYGRCGKISGINTNTTISFSLDGNPIIEDCKFGTVNFSNQKVRNITATTANFFYCTNLYDIRLTAGGTATYTNCKYVDPFTCEKFGSGVPMIDGNGAVTFVESAEGGSYGS